MSCGVAIGLLASDITQKGFFWKSTAMILRGAPLRIAGAVMSGAPMPSRALPDATTASCWTLGPPAMRLTLENPPSV